MCILPQSRYRRIPSQIRSFENLLVDNFHNSYTISGSYPRLLSSGHFPKHLPPTFVRCLFLLSPTERNVSSLMDCCCLAVLTVLVLFMGATAHYTASHSTSPHPLPLAFFPPHLPPCSGRPGNIDTMYNLWTCTTVFS